MNSLLLLFVYLMLCILLGRRAYSSDFYIVRWLGIVLPATPMLLLSAVPLDIVTVFVWFPAVIAAIVSLHSLGKQLFALRDPENSTPHKKLRWIRPFLACYFFITAIVLLRHSRELTEEFAFAVATEAQKLCKETQVCPEVPPLSAGFRVDRSERREHIMSHRGLFASYPIRYRSSEDQKSFSMYIRHNIDGGAWYRGGVKLDLEQGIKSGP